MSFGRRDNGEVKQIGLHVLPCIEQYVYTRSCVGFQQTETPFSKLRHLPRYVATLLRTPPGLYSYGVTGNLGLSLRIVSPPDPPRAETTFLALRAWYQGFPYLCFCSFLDDHRLLLGTLLGIFYYHRLDRTNQTAMVLTMIVLNSACQGQFVHVRQSSSDTKDAKTVFLIGRWISMDFPTFPYLDLQARNARSANSKCQIQVLAQIR